MSVFSIYILKQLKERAISRATFAREIGKNESSINSWIEKEVIPRDEFLKIITDYFNTDYIELRNLIEEEKLRNKQISKENKVKMPQSNETTLADRAIAIVDRRWMEKIISKVFEMPPLQARALLEHETTLELERLSKLT